MALSSWRFVTVRYYQCGWQDIELTVAWDSPANQKYASYAPRCYCFSGPTLPLTPAERPEQCFTNVLAMTGADTAFDPEQRHSLEELPSDLILLVEVASSNIHWMAPGDMAIDELPSSITSGPDGKGAFVAFADCEVWLLDKDIPLELLRAFMTIEGASRFDREERLTPYCVYRRPDSRGPPRSDF